MMNNFNLDAAATVFFNRQLEHIKTQIADVLYASLKANELIPVDTTTPEGAEVVTYRQFDSTGTAKIISNYADDIPLVDINAKEYTSRLRTIADAYIISIQDVKAANYARVDVEQRRFISAIRVQQQYMNRLAFFGDVNYGLIGWLTNPNVDNQLVAGATAADKRWINKTPTAILKDLNDAVTFIVSATNGVEFPNRLVLPIEQYQIIANTPISTTNNTTILEQFTRNYPEIQVIWANELKGAFTGTTDGFILYNYSREKLYQEVPYLFEVLPPQWQNMAYKVICHSRYGGTIVVYPQSMVFRRGI